MYDIKSIPRFDMKNTYLDRC